MSLQTNVTVYIAETQGITSLFYFMVVDVSGNLIYSNYMPVGNNQTYINGVEYYTNSVNLNYNPGNYIIMMNTTDNITYTLDNSFTFGTTFNLSSVYIYFTVPSMNTSLITTLSNSVSTYYSGPLKDITTLILNTNVQSLNSCLAPNYLVGDVPAGVNTQFYTYHNICVSQTLLIDISNYLISLIPVPPVIPVQPVVVNTHEWLWILIIGLIIIGIIIVVGLIIYFVSKSNKDKELEEPIL